MMHSYQGVINDEAYMMHTTLMDVQRLTQESSLQAREVLAAKVATDFRSDNFSAKEAIIAEEIFRILVKDSEASIRQTLARELAHCTTAPHDVIVRLAHDATEIATPVLEHSQVLTENDLVELVQGTREIARLCAVARRKNVPEAVSEVLLETRQPLTLDTLLANPGAVLGEAGLLAHWQSFTTSPSLLQALVAREQLPLTIVDKLYHAVSEELKTALTKRYPRHSPSIAKASQDAREWELLGITPHEGADNYDEEASEDFIDDLYLRGKLSHSLLMRALCVGNLAVFEMGIAKLAHVPRVNARILMMEASGQGLKAIYDTAGMPEGFFEAVRVLLKISLEETGYGRTWSSDLRKRVIDRIYMGQYHRTVDNMEYVLSIIGGHAPVPANVH